MSLVCSQREQKARTSSSPGSSPASKLPIRCSVRIRQFPGASEFVSPITNEITTHQKRHNERTTTPLTQFMKIGLNSLPTLPPANYKMRRRSDPEEQIAAKCQLECHQNNQSIAQGHIDNSGCHLPHLLFERLRNPVFLAADLLLPVLLAYLQPNQQVPSEKIVEQRSRSSNYPHRLHSS